MVLGQPSFWDLRFEVGGDGIGPEGVAMLRRTPGICLSRQPRLVAPGALNMLNRKRVDMDIESLIDVHA